MNICKSSPSFKDTKSTVCWGSAATKERVQRFLDSTYGGNISEFLRRLALEKVTAWEERQALLQKELSA